MAFTEIELQLLKEGWGSRQMSLRTLRLKRLGLLDGAGDRPTRLMDGGKPALLAGEVQLNGNGANKDGLRPEMVRGLMVGIVGQVSAGKSTLAERLAALTGARAFIERFKDNPYFEAYYTDLKWRRFPSPNVLPSQKWFLDQSVAQLKEAHEHLSSGVIVDGPPYHHRMFAELTREQGIMSPEDFEEYKGYYDEQTKGLVMPDILLVATRPIEQIEAMIVGRGRPEEQEIDRAYWQAQEQYCRYYLPGGSLHQSAQVVVDLRQIPEQDWDGGGAEVAVWQEILVKAGL